jgi:hypothetical protein
MVSAPRTLSSGGFSLSLNQKPPVELHDVLVATMLAFVVKWRRTDGGGFLSQEDVNTSPTEL